jgi:dipeptidyl-peptidase 4
VARVVPRRFGDEAKRKLSNPSLAANLQVLPAHSLRLVDALIEADKDVDLLIIPGVEHSLRGRRHYAMRRSASRHFRGRPVHS